MVTRGFSIKKKVTSLTEPVELDLLKTYVQVRSGFHDTLLTELLTEARERVEKFLCLSLVETEITVRWEELSTEELPYGPVKSLTSVSDSSGTIVSFVMEGMLESNVSIRANRSEPTVIKYIGGFTEDVPKPIKLAIMKLVCDNFEFRTGITLETVQQLPNDWKKTCRPYRRIPWTA